MSRMEISAKGTQTWYNDRDQIHRDNGPAIIYSHGVEAWYQNGLKHRDNGPAIIRDFNGDREWWQNGKLHRLDGPAIILQDSGYHWYQNGMRHKEDGIASHILIKSAYGHWEDEWCLFDHVLWNSHEYYESDDIPNWLEEHGIIGWPLTEEQMLLFKLRWA